MFIDRQWGILSTIFNANEFALNVNDSRLDEIIMKVNKSVENIQPRKIVRNVLHSNRKGENVNLKEWCSNFDVCVGGRTIVWEL